MQKIKLITENTNISKLKMTKLNWDVVVRAVPYQIVRIDGYVHTIGGKWGENNLWMYPRNGSPTYETLVEYNGNGGVCWGIRHEPHNYIRTKWGESECFTSGRTVITRNGKDFYNMHGIDYARVLIEELDEHPLGFNTIDYDKKMIGRKVWWRSEPAVISRWIDGAACVILVPDGIKKFTVPAEFASGEPDYYEDGNVVTTVFDKHIWWFRDDD